MQNDIIRSVILTPVPPAKTIQDVGYLEVDARNKKLAIYDDLGQKSTITSTEEFDKKIQNLSTAIDKKLDKNNILVSGIISAAGFYDTTQGKIISGGGVSGDYLTKNNPTGTGTLTIDKLNNGRNCTISGDYSHAQGIHTYTYSSGSHAEGNFTEASGNYSHAEGNYSKTFGQYSHAEGSKTQAAGKGSHAEGKETITNGQYSHAEGIGTIAKYDYQHVAGKYNTTIKAAYIIGGGSSDTNRKNIFMVDWDGNVQSNTEYLNNKIYNGTVVNNIYNALYSNGNIHFITVSTDTQLIVTGIPQGCTLKIQINVNKNVNIRFGNSSDIIISEAGQYQLTFININEIIKLIGNAVKISNSDVPLNMPLTFIANSDSTVKISKNGSPNTKTFQYRINTGEWINYTIDYSISLAQNDILQFKSSSVRLNYSNSNYYYFITDGKLDIKGNIMSLVNFSTEIIYVYEFANLFLNCKSIQSAKNLLLPATTLAVYCYYGMFKNCTNLISAPELPATTLADNCYQSMFNGCTNLISAPALPATTLKWSCYDCMFTGCTCLINAPEISATTLANKCCRFMFYNCTSLTTAPKLPATTLAKECYIAMFRGCTSLSSAPELPATTLADSCYYSMFQGCRSLVSVSELPATTLVDGCYYSMFWECILLSHIEVAFTDWNISLKPTLSWFYNVASSGTFICPSALEEIRGTSNIPNNWTIVRK